MGDQVPYGTYIRYIVYIIMDFIGIKVCLKVSFEEQPPFCSLLQFLCEECSKDV